MVPFFRGNTVRIQRIVAYVIQEYVYVYIYIYIYIYTYTKPCL